MKTSADMLTEYEKGVIARALLESLIKQGYLEERPENDEEFEVRFRVKKWHLELLACFSESAQSARREQQERHEKLIKLR